MIEAHLNKLPEIYKAPITLKIMEGLSIKEVSDALEIPEKTIRSQIERGIV
jgi:DNA-directed RNA polymerase specialized sigma24 family protein